jgi:hypothetical protein
MAINLEVISRWAEANPILFALILFWIFVSKGVALWHAANLQQRYWFVIIMLVNTFGILDIAYLYFVARKYKVEVVEKE